METVEAKSCVDPFTMQLQRLVDEDAVGQLVRRDSIMLRLGSDKGKVKLDWVDRVDDLIRDEALLREVFIQATAILNAGIRHVLWCGMGGSVVGVQALVDLAAAARGGPPLIAPYTRSYRTQRAIDAHCGCQRIGIRPPEPWPVGRC